MPELHRMLRLLCYATVAPPHQCWLSCDLPNYFNKVFPQAATQASESLAKSSFPHMQNTSATQASNCPNGAHGNTAQQANCPQQATMQCQKLQTATQANRRLHPKRATQRMTVSCVTLTAAQACRSGSNTPQAWWPECMMSPPRLCHTIISRPSTRASWNSS